MTVEACAKINLTLEVCGKRPDGYHALRSVVQPITLADTLEIEPTQDGSVSSDTGYGERDLIVRAAKALNVGCHVRVTKRIPAGGGLGGGSADAAATLRALNELGHLGFTPEKLAEIGASVGSDVPALVLAQHYRRPVLMEGRGEKVSLLQPSTFNLQLSTFNLVLVNPGVFCSTPEVFAHHVPRTVRRPEGALFNDLQEAAVALHPEIGEVLANLRAAGASNVLMTGSGATVFGFAKDAAEADRLTASMRRLGYSAWSCELQGGAGPVSREGGESCPSGF